MIWSASNLLVVSCWACDLTICIQRHQTQLDGYPSRGNPFAIKSNITNTNTNESTKAATWAWWPQLSFCYPKQHYKYKYKGTNSSLMAVPAGAILLLSNAPLQCQYPSYLQQSSCYHTQESYYTHRSLMDFLLVLTRSLWRNEDGGGPRQSGQAALD